MTAIGNLERLDDDTFVGNLNLMTINAQIRFYPIENKSRDTSPDFRVYAGRAEIGAGWWKNSQAGNAYISVSLASPELGPRTLYCSLVQGSSDEAPLPTGPNDDKARRPDPDRQWTLLWSPRNGD